MDRRQDALAESDSQLLKEVASLNRRLGAKEGEVDRLTSENMSLMESQEGVKMQLAMSQSGAGRLEWGKKEALSEADRLKAELVEERLGRKKEKLALEKNVTQLQRKVCSNPSDIHATSYWSAFDRCFISGEANRRFNKSVQPSAVVPETNPLGW